jgi:hypothetical protein
MPSPRFWISGPVYGRWLTRPQHLFDGEDVWVCVNVSVVRDDVTILMVYQMAVDRGIKAEIDACPTPHSVVRVGRILAQESKDTTAPWV